MEQLITRAATIAELLRPPATAVSRDFAEAAIACCGELIDTGEPRLALDLIERLDLIGPFGTEWEIRVLVTRLRALRVSGAYEKGLELARRALVGRAERLRDYPVERWLIRIGEGACLWQLNRVDEAIEGLLAVRQELIVGPDSAVLAKCMLELSSAEIFRGRLQQARAHTLEAIVSSRRCADRYVESVALGNLARIEKFLCRWSSSKEAIEAALEINDSDGHRAQSLITRQLSSIVAWKQGQLKEALQTARRCQFEARALGHEIHEWYATQVMGLITLQQGQAEAARALLGEGTQRDAVNAESRRALLTSEFIGDTYLEEGDAATALERYNAVWPLALALIPKGDIVAELRRRRSEAYYLLGREEEAYAEATTSLNHCRELGDRYEEAATYRMLALSSAALGRPTEAKKWFEQGFAYYDDIETPYEWGKLWMAYGDWLQGPNAGDYGSPAGALEAYSAAHDHFERMGALKKVAEASQKVAACKSKGDVYEPHATASHETVAEVRRPLRRPRGGAELERRSVWARDVFGFITRNKIVLDLMEDVAKLARSGSPILILGESGTGKELIAKGAHRLSNRSGSFTPINCGALPRDVIESELFGHVAGAFTGATRDKVGLFESCDGGTVFLDEIADMSLDLQAKLLRFLETGEFRRVGSNRNVAVDTLVVAATNREKRSLEAGESFRPDLYYRLAHAVVVLPPLRRRGEDVDLLISHFLEEAGERHERRVRLSASARARLRAYSWPGNVRQLRSTLNRLVILGREGEIAEENIELDEQEVPTSLTEELLQAERRRIVEALAQAGGVRTEAARALGMSRTTFVSKMKRYGIT